MITGLRKEGRAGNFLTQSVKSSPTHLISDRAHASPARRTVKDVIVFLFPSPTGAFVLKVSYCLFYF